MEDVVSGDVSRSWVHSFRIVNKINTTIATQSIANIWTTGCSWMKDSIGLVLYMKWWGSPLALLPPFSGEPLAG